MGIQAMTPPAQAREAKYSWPDAELDTAREMLKAHREDKSNAPPGDGPYDTEGEARSAGNALAVALGEKDTAGIRVWVDGKTKTENRKRGEKTIKVEVGKWFFSLKGSRKAYNKDENPSENGSGAS